VELLVVGTDYPRPLPAITEIQTLVAVAVELELLEPLLQAVVLVLLLLDTQFRRN
jgi:hypothetical protein